MMTKILLPPLPENAINKDRPVSGLLRAQILHLHEAERRLPPRHRTKIYVNAIKTEGEAAEYARAVTEAIHEAHAAAAAKRSLCTKINSVLKVGLVVPLKKRPL